MNTPSMHNKPGSRRRTRRGFTLIEIIVVIVIIGVLAGMIAPRLLSRVGQGKQSAAASGATTIASQVKIYMSETGAKLEGGSLEFLIKRPTSVDASVWHGPYLDNAESLKDPWGKPYILRVPPEKNFDFDIVSYGRDGKPGGKDEDADIVKP